jgi:hypothetical protein
MDLLKKRLTEGLGDSVAAASCRFVVDDDDDKNKNKLGKVSSLGNQTKTTDDEEWCVLHVKTLIWEVVFFQEKASSSGNKEEEEEAEEDPKKILATSGPHYFATVLGYHDRVDESQLKTRLVESHHDDDDDDDDDGRQSTIASHIMEASSTNQVTKKNDKSFLYPTRMDCDDRSHPQNQNQPWHVLRLQLAETNKAEELTGYMSGTIPPVAHSTPMVLLMEEALLASNHPPAGQNHGSTSKDDNNKDHHRSRKKFIVSMGSGSFCHSLWIPVDDFLPIAKALHKNAQVCVVSFKMLQASSSSLHQQQQLPVITREAQRLSSQHAMYLAAAAARTGDLESKELLVETIGKQFFFGLDPGDSTIGSTGEGNCKETRKYRKRKATLCCTWRTIA